MAAMRRAWRPDRKGRQSMSRLRMAVVGVGHLGKEHARVLAGLPEVELVGVGDDAYLLGVTGQLTGVDWLHAPA